MHRKPLQQTFRSQSRCDVRLYFSTSQVMPTAVKCHVRSVSAVVTCVEELKAVVGPQKSSDTWKASAYQAGQGFGQTPTTKLGQSMHATNVFKKVRKEEL